MENQNLDRKKRKEEQKRKKAEKFAKKQAAPKVEPKKVVEKVKIKNLDVIQKTPEGEFKNIDNEMGSFDPLVVEEGWFGWWQKEGFFKPETIEKHREDSKGPYVIPIPPPNVTGKLHIGHAMMIAIQDSIARYKRMQGHEVLFVPGTDHAGIATQTVVEKKLYKEEKLTRHDLGREKFLEKVWEWKNQYGDTILDQIKRMGTSVDMDRFAFTLDDKRNKAVIEAFVILYEKGLIYRDERLVNWSSKLSTAISDLEVDHKDLPANSKVEVDGKTHLFGVLYHLKYPVADKKTKMVINHLEIATTRPETILGDTALCMNPKDPRAAEFASMVAINPLTKKEIPIIFDEFANMEFGSGVVKITPAHDFKDFELGKKHNLEILQIMNEKNEISMKSEFYGMKRFDARVAVVDFLKKQDLFIKTEEYSQTLPFCSRSGDILEPLIKKQWWMNCTKMAQKSLEAVRDGQIDLFPEQAISQWNFWLENIRDWCLSRQLWWGHRIPAYQVYKKDENKTKLGWIIARNEEEAKTKATEKFKTQDFTLEQDEDVLDTWFSSALWPFAIMGWPENTPDFLKYFPAQLLETGSDILFFWVARMVMCSFAIFDKPPFSTILLHGIVRDANGRKMSKSLGNVVDPIHVIEGISLDKLKESVTSTNLQSKEIATALDSQEKDYPNGISRCGADALRFTLCAYTSGLKDINLNINRAEGYRKFCNKIWNAFKFVTHQIERSGLNKSHIDNFTANYCTANTSGKDLAETLQNLTLSENRNKFNSSKAVIEWLMMHRNALIQEYELEMDSFNFMNVTQKVHSFFLFIFCDVFIEITKKTGDLNQIAAAAYILNDTLLLLHPFLPFITEELFQRLKKYNLFESAKSITIQQFPQTTPRVYVHNEFTDVIQAVKTIRSLIDSLNCTDKYKKYKINTNRHEISVFDKEIRFLCNKVESVQFVPQIEGDCQETFNEITVQVVIQ